MNMVNNVGNMGTQGTLKMLSDWTDRVAHRRAAVVQAVAPARRRAQCRDHGVGLVEPDRLPA